ncbi:GIY-YIG nuclease family protein [Nocardia cyriacigeorgica]|uniref:GIY-YIG nuclease family protein n=1 Tax=Nocardia cyriacigeorgica TaxID=135487 RepID=UPI0018952D97|nr:GIY-YIG nuclease family protein [Nocardia cyriacigeorgica]MBF6397902.1 GIY-YIG nuclease family protein [Nocardia cyriacigeorgica]MBF6402441.1 GIY-YIG nuclease family protein [Nocardia cyriacigeorgica]
MSSHGKASLNAKTKAPKRIELPAADVRDFRSLLKQFLSETDSQGRVWSSAKWGVYAFFDYDGEPIYVGQTNEQLRVRIQRHLTNQRTDAVAMRILDIFEVAEVAVWPLWEYEGVTKKNDPDAFARAQSHLNQCEYTAYVNAIENSRYHAILNEKIPPVSAPCVLPPSLRRPLISEQVRHEREHADIRIARRAEAIARLAAVARERGEVSPGLRRALVVQAIRLTYLSAQRLAYVEARPDPDPAAINVASLVGSVYEETTEPTPDAEPEDADTEDIDAEDIE